MTDKEAGRQEKRVMALARRWFDPLWLKWWRIDLEYYRELIPETNNTGDFVTIFSTTSQYQYGTALIKCNLEAITKQTDEILEELFVHECAHIILSEMRWYDQDHNHEERVATWLARAFIAVRGCKPRSGRRAG